MFKRRDIPPVLLLLLLIILVMLTLSQILVVHNGRYGRNVHNMRRLQLELREMDINLHSLMMQNVPSIELNRRILQNEINTARFVQILEEASKVDPKAAETRRRRQELRERGVSANSTDVNAVRRRRLKANLTTHGKAGEVAWRPTAPISDQNESRNRGSGTSRTGASGAQPQTMAQAAAASPASSGSDIPRHEREDTSRPINDNKGWQLNLSSSETGLQQQDQVRSLPVRPHGMSDTEAKKTPKYCPSIPPTLSKSCSKSSCHPAHLVTPLTK